MARDEDLWAAPVADAPAPTPAAPYLRYPDEAVWLTDPWGEARAAALEAWLERRLAVVLLADTVEGVRDLLAGRDRVGSAERAAVAR